MAKKQEINCPQCGGKGKKKYAGKKHEQTCNYCGGSGKATVWK